MRVLLSYSVLYLNDKFTSVSVDFLGLIYALLYFNIRVGFILED